MIYFIAYMLIGVVSGAVSGLLGIGGGTFVIPALVWVYKNQHMAPELVMHMAAGTSLAVMILTTAASLQKHVEYGAHDWLIYRKFFVGMVVGTSSGAVLGRFLPSEFLQILFGVFVFLIAVRLILAIKSKPSATLPKWWGMFIAAFICGAASGLLGIGAGTLIVPFLVYCNVHVRVTVATAIACSFTIAIVGTLAFILTGLHVPNLPNWSSGYVYWPAFFGIVLTGPLFAQFGATLSHKLRSATLTRILGIAMLIIAIKMLMLA